jgi:dihydrofolate reductase
MDRHLTLIVAVDRNWGIGYRGGLLTRVKGDMRHFRSYTEGKIVILGAKTLASFPGGRPLKNRRHIVLTHRTDFHPEGVLVAHSVEEALALLDKTPSLPDDSAVVIGGEAIYRQFLPYVKEAVVSRFDGEFPHDAVFPNLDRNPDWEIVSVGREQVAGPEDSHPGMTWRIVTYRQKAPAGADAPETPS